MSLTFTYNGSTITHDIAPSGINIPTHADGGDAAMGGLPIQDPDGTLAIVGWKLITVEESDCSQPRLFTGYTMDRSYARSPERGLLTGPEALGDTTITDINALFSFRPIAGSDRKRPAETWGERLTWLLGIDELAGLIEDTGYVAQVMDPGYLAYGMDEADYSNQPPAAVFGDLLDRFEGAQLTYYAFWDPDANKVGLFLDPISAAVRDSTLSISNVESDVDGDTCFAPLVDAALTRSPDQTYSEVVVEYGPSSKRLFRRRPSTAANFIRRGTTISRPHTQNPATASSQAESFLDAHAGELDQIDVTMSQVPSSRVGLIAAGQRIAVRFTHLRGYESWTSMRVTSYTPTPTTDLADYWDIALTLIAPRAAPAGGGGSECEDATPTDSWPPMNSTTSDADGNVQYCNPFSGGVYYPDPFHAGGWNFFQSGAGGSPDFAGSGVSNSLRVAVIGAGVITVETVIYVDGAQNLQADLWHWTGSENVLDETQFGTAGDTFTFIVPADGQCNHYLSIYDLSGPSGSKWGFAGASFTAGEPDTEVILPPAPPATDVETTDPTVTDDAAHGFAVGSRWINTATGHEFVLVDDTNGAAVWLDLTPTEGLTDPTTDLGDMIYRLTAGTETVENATSPTGNVLVVTGLAETILPGCDLQLSETPSGSVFVTIDAWISQNRNGVSKQATLRLRRTNVSGGVLASSVKGDSGDSSAGHQAQWSTTYEDTTPTDGHYVLTVQETAGDGSTEIWSDTRTFELESAYASGLSALPIGDAGDVLTVVAGVPAWEPPTGGPAALDDLADVDAPTPADGDGIVWRAGPAAWVNEHALTEGDVIAMLTPDIYACASLSVIGGRGTIAAGAHTDLHAVGGTTVQIDELTGAIGFNIEAAFTGVDGLTDVYVHGYYTGGLLHADTDLEIYNYDTTSWDVLFTFGTSGSVMQLYHVAIADGSPYFDGGGNAVVRFYHPSNGNPAHRLYLDYLAISHSAGTTGGLALDDLTDVTAPAPDDGDVLAWDDGTSQWVNVAPGGVAEITDVPTAETDTALVLHPDGTGGVEWGTDETGGGGYRAPFFMG